MGFVVGFMFFVVNVFFSFFFAIYAKSKGYSFFSFFFNRPVGPIFEHFTLGRVGRDTETRVSCYLLLTTGIEKTVNLEYCVNNKPQRLPAKV
jgi:hypothetical protein